MKIAFVNGPNLNLVGRREPEIYGRQNLESFLDQLASEFKEVQFERFQSNVEGELVRYIQEAEAGAIVLNAGAYTHTSIALGDAVAAVTIPIIEVHISNVYKREVFRQHSYIAPHVAGTITGFGLAGYRLAVLMAMAL